MSKDRPDYKAMLEFFKGQEAKREKCSHSNAYIQDDDGVYSFSCPDCGRRGWSDRKGAIKLGWIDEKR